MAAAVLGARQVYFLGGDEGGPRRPLPRPARTTCRLGSSSTARSSRARSRSTRSAEEDQKTVADHELRSEDDALLADRLARVQGRAAPSPPRRTGRATIATDARQRRQPGGRRRRRRKPRAAGSRRGGARRNGRGRRQHDGPLPARTDTAHERPQPRAVRAGPGRAAARSAASPRSSSSESDEIGDVSLIYGGYFFALCLGGPHPPAAPPAARRPLPVPAGAAAGRVRSGGGLPDRRRPGGPAGDALPARARPLRGDDHLPARLPRARALPLPDRDRLDRSCCVAAGFRASAAQVNGAYLGSTSARSRSSPPRSRRSAIVIFLASYLAENREMLSVAAGGSWG